MKLNHLVEELIRALKDISIEDIMEFEEEYDEQYKALRKLYEEIGNKNFFIPLTILNALVSYQLSGTGEEYWWEFSDYFRNRDVKDPVNDMIEFVKKSIKNKRLTEVKIKRLKQARRLIKSISERERILCEKPENLIKLLQTTYKSKGVQKTFSFSVKMLNYACRIKYRIRKPMPKNVPIPQDVRVTKVTGKIIRNESVTELWDKISKAVDIPPLHLDSIIWITYGMIRRKVEIKNKKMAKIYNFLKKLIVSD